MCNAIRGHSDNRRAWEVATLGTAERYYPTKRKGVEKQIQSDFFRNCLIASDIGYQAGAS